MFSMRWEAFSVAMVIIGTLLHFYGASPAQAQRQGRAAGLQVIELETGSMERTSMPIPGEEQVSSHLKGPGNGAGRRRERAASAPAGVLDRGLGRPFGEAQDVEGGRRRAAASGA